MSNADYADRFMQGLGLETQPIAVAFADSAPAGVPIAAQAAPSSCAFWRRAEDGVFFAPAEAHFNCPVGAMVMGFDLPQSVSDELMQLVGTMTQCGYVAAEEPNHIPANSAKKGAKGVLYGPLKDFPVAPDAVIAWLTPAQAMIWSEALGGATWGGSQPATVTGRPACAALPRAFAGNGALSFGCIGMRTYTGIADDRLLAVCGGADLDTASSAIAGMRAVNDGMQAFYRDRAAGLGIAL